MDEVDTNRICVVGIGASAGGLEAIREMLAQATPDANFAYVVIQHLDPNHESLLAELLGRQTALQVTQATDGVRIERGRVYIIPPGHGLSVENRVLHLTDFEQPRGLRRPIDDFFESLARDQGRYAACVILSGTGADGSAGLRAIKEFGGLCVAQDPETARYDGMPMSAKATGLVDFIRAPGRIIETISQFYSHSSLQLDDVQLGQSIEAMVPDICAVVRKTSGHDFALYKISTLTRRIERRIRVLGLSDALDYLRRLRVDANECDKLFRELLINVTRFFRDPEQFEALRQRVIEPLVQESTRDEIRVWIPGCSSGEEAYSMAMLFHDAQQRVGHHQQLQIFATDIDEQMLRIARQGTYPQAALADIPEPFRDLYTVGRDGKFQIVSHLRDRVRFSLHSVVRDPPFSNIDLLSCRNLLIYFGDKLQAEVMPIFHFALRPGGTLFLGPSETVGQYDKHFIPTAASARIFTRDDSRSSYPLLIKGQADQQQTSRIHLGEKDDSPNMPRTSTTEAEARLLNAYANPAMVVDRSGKILKTSGKLSKYLDIDLLDTHVRHAQSVARPGLKEAISAAIRHVAETGRKSVNRDLSAHSEFGVQKLELLAEPLPDRSILLVFRDAARFTPIEDHDFDEVEPSDSHVQSLEEELRATRARLHTTVEELETANEELKSSNEEMMSMNEELQSTNEELSTVNDELKNKIEELSVANADLQNFFASTALPLIVVDQRLHIRNYTESILTLYPFRHGDRGRPLTDVTSYLNENTEIFEATRQVIARQQVQQLTITQRESDKTWSLVINPYRIRSGEIDGATLVFTDISQALTLEQELAREGERLKLALEVAGLGVWEYDRRANTLDMDARCRSLFRLDENDDLSKPRTLLRHVLRDDREILRDGLRQMAGPEGNMDIAIRLDTKDLSPPTLKIVGRRLSHDALGRRVGVIFDVTDAQEAMQIRETMLREMNHRVKNMFSIISGMTRIAGRKAGSVKEFTTELEQRIAALARSHSLTQSGDTGRGLMLREVVKVALEPYEKQAEIRIDGPEVYVQTKEINALSLLFHELATNAAKYGVLGPTEGTLQVSWTVAPKNKLILEWNELYSNRVIPGESTIGSGFGSTLIKLSAAQLHGDIEVETSEEKRTTRLSYGLSD
ncbi:chemotaxis protein CheB [Thioclava litoralis]|uniref:Chemotaxis protein CheB n=1 Tax=Thioclava litoralis TaxID=3076557 RepID=A0ABZ1E2E9_9RHOB|nr:chemotaxis protein CheB [Thioclava sp. FTW29]